MRVQLLNSSLYGREDALAVRDLLWIHQWQREMFVSFECATMTTTGRHERDVELSKIDSFISAEIERAAQLLDLRK